MNQQFVLSPGHKDCFKVNDVFCCLGTTIKKLVSQEAFKKVDVEYPPHVSFQSNCRDILESVETGVEFSKTLWLGANLFVLEKVGVVAGICDEEDGEGLTNSCRLPLMGFTERGSFNCLTDR